MKSHQKKRVKIIQALIFGDVGYGNGTRNIAAMASIKWQVDFSLHLGDIAYADDWTANGYEQILNYFMSTLEKLADYLSYMD